MEHDAVHELAEWLAAQDRVDPLDVEAELAEGERRRVFVVDELLEAGYAGGELLLLVMRLTGLGDAAARELIERRERRLQREAPPSRRDEQLAKNEIAFRALNENRAAWSDPASPSLELVCECSDPDCIATFVMEAAEYAWLRQHPLRFVVLPGHEAPAIEDVVTRGERYAIVEKHPETHGQVEAADPRASR